jgi:hypothetical protein
VFHDGREKICEIINELSAERKKRSGMTKNKCTAGTGDSLIAYRRRR